MIEVLVAALLVAPDRRGDVLRLRAAGPAGGRPARARAGRLARPTGPGPSEGPDAVGAGRLGLGDRQHELHPDRSTARPSRSPPPPSSCPEAARSPARTSGTTTADEVQTTSTVSWPPNNDGRGPVVVNGLVAPPEGGSLIVRAANSQRPAVGSHDHAQRRSDLAGAADHGRQRLRGVRRAGRRRLHRHRDGHRLREREHGGDGGADDHGEHELHARCVRVSHVSSCASNPRTIAATDRSARRERLHADRAAGRAAAAGSSCPRRRSRS